MSLVTGYNVIDGPLTKTAAFNGSSVDISALTQDFSVVVEVSNLPAGCVAAFHIEDSVDAFTNKIARDGRGFTGKIDATAPVRHVFRRRHMQGIRGGTTSAVLRVALDAVTGAGATVTYNAWIEEGS